MYLSKELTNQYTLEKDTAREAQRLAEFIAWSPVIFQASRIMVKYGILDLIRDSSTEGITAEEICQHCALNEYAVKCLLEASLCIGITKVNTENDHYCLSKTGWFLLNDPATKVNLEFNHEFLYNGIFHLEESLKNGTPEGFNHTYNKDSKWHTLYEALSSLPQNAKDSWFNFDHFYSDNSFDTALKIVFGQKNPCRLLYDVGGNTGRWARRCVEYDPEVNVTIIDLPQQIALMQEQTKDCIGADRIHGIGMNFLDKEQIFPKEEGLDAIWMSQFLDCFSIEEIVSILHRATAVMEENTKLYIMETLWDRQRYEPAALCLTMTSLYFSAMANGNSKMYNTADLQKCINEAGLVIEQIYDAIGQGHSILVCRKCKLSI